ncbi:LysM domain-containing protein [Eubacterium aggregans]|uniref:LysM domain-containing protein n=1 Tax=Eubacterium aggregans TaxID=81409 RepID=A0A1H3Y643_9FIRM|nr:GH25 family lysozyme [Eubacterium aggregans]SEA06318.1 LysM domain-containing protein [Eubacterium aggregans]
MSLNGIDISAWQRGIDLDAVPADFVIIKATEGLDYVSGDCDRAYQQAKSGGKKVGVYHFADGNSSGTAEANYFVDNVAGYVGEAILILDWETNAVNCGPGYAKEFLDHVQARTGIKPMIYMSGSVVNEWDWSGVVAGDYGLWVAYYSLDSCNGYVPDAAMYPISDWAGAAMLQYTSGGYLPGWGDRLDLNVFYGDSNAWDAYAGGGTGVIVQPQPEPAPEATENAQNTSIYVVQEGDTLSGIADQYDTTYQHLAAINGIVNPDVIYPGQVIVIDGVASGSGQTYTIQSGDTLGGIAGMFGTSVGHLAELNGIENPDVIYAGDTIRIN